ncbi:MAG: AAA domain-containing protein [Spirosomataceae bacterium]
MTQSILKTYLRRLTNLTSRNRSLLLTRLSSEQFLDVHELNFLNSASSFELVQLLIGGKEQIPLCQVIDSRFEKVNEVSKQLRKIARTEAFIKEERGAEDLYVGYPFVKGKFADGSVVNAPLLFFPVTLRHVPMATGEKWILKQREEPISLNRSFLLAYSHFNQVTISNDLLETSFEEYDRDSTVFLTQLYEFLKNSPLEINFNQDLFTKQLVHFQELSKSDLTQLEKNGELKLYPQAVLGIFPQAGSYLAPDYEELLNQTPLTGELEEDLRSFFKHADSTSTSASEKTSSQKEEALLTPLPVDASQEQALWLVKQGQSLVVQGPPGTGKSQLIANLMTDFAARGKRVLLVCQKRVALDTVYQRLHRLGMGAFVALVHDFKNDRRALYAQLANQIEQVEAYQKQNYSLNTIVLERDYLQTCRRIDQLSTELQALKTALFDESRCGCSAKKLYLTSHLQAPHISLEGLHEAFHFQQLDDFLRRLRSYEAYAQRVNATAHPWADRVDFSTFRWQDLASIDQAIEDVPSFCQQLSQQTQQLGKVCTYAEFQELLQVRESIDTITTLLREEVVAQLFQKKQQSATFQQQFEQQQNELHFYQQQGLLTAFRSDELAGVGALLRRAIEARHSMLNWWFFGEKSALETTMTALGLSTQLQDLQVVERQLVNRLAFEQGLAHLETLGGLPKPLNTNLLSATVRQYEHLLSQWQEAQEVATLFEQLPAWVQRWLQSLPNDTLRQTFQTLTELLDDFNQKQIYWQQYLTAAQIETLAKQSAHADVLQTSLREDFEWLHEADVLKKSFNRVEVEVVNRLFEMVNQTIEAERTIPADELFLNSLRLAWLETIEMYYPILRGVSALKVEQMEAELQTSVQKKQAFSREILLLQLREHTYKNVEVNRLQNVVTYRNLKHQVTKKRNVWAIRKLIAELSEEVFPLVPCWMASPEAVSAVFPLRPSADDARPEVFDLVIFDEASQCFAEHGLPALYRGQQVVVAGDSKQLQPTDLYRIRLEDSSEDMAELELDSLLDLACHYLPQTQLQGHYRSHSLDLIDFSNQYFYKNSLQLLPHFEEINRLEPAIRYLKTDGVWQHNTNQLEAQQVVDLVQHLSQQEPGQSIGIVTFNHPQQQLIQDLLEVQQFMEASEQSEEPIFVKNIENVQGDERDIIIFSVGYAPDAKGRMAMQFGSLNLTGGEHRLNVAITRARRRIYVIASILPAQLEVEQVTNEGPRLLKKYLDYALHVSEGHYKPRPKPIEGFRQGWLLKSKLKPVVSTEKSAEPSAFTFELPFADVTVKKGSQYDSLILTDDDLYYQSLSPKEAHAYLPLNLSAKGWKFRRIWSRNWWKTEQT